MSEKTLRRLVVALAAAALVYSTLGIARRLGGGLSSGNSGFARALQRVDTATLRTVRMVGPSDSVELVRTDDAWVANGFATDADEVARLLGAVASSSVGDVAATNPTNHERLGVAGPDTWTIGFEDVDGRNTQVLLGKTGVRFGSAFARLPDEDIVVTLIGDLRPSVVKPLDQWRNKLILETEVAQVVGLSLTAGEQTYGVTRQEDGWELEGAPADSFSVNTLLTELSSVTAVGFLAQGAEPEGEPRSLVATAANGDTLAHLSGWVGEGTFLVASRTTSVDPDVVYEVSDWRADRLMPPIDSLRATR